MYINLDFPQNPWPTIFISVFDNFIYGSKQLRDSQLCIIINKLLFLNYCE